MRFCPLRAFPWRRFFAAFSVSAILISSAPLPRAEAAQAGLKYNRPKYEYPDQVLPDLDRFARDRLRALMIALPWESWEPWEGKLDEPFIRTKLSAVLQRCYENGIQVILASHSSFWGSHGNWTIPDWVRRKPGYRSATSALTDPGIRALHADYLKRWIAATQHFPAVIGYNILNEPAVATQWYVENPAGRREFEARWEGTLEITKTVHDFMKAGQVTQFLVVGNGNADPGLEKFIWKTSGAQDLTPLWTEWTGRMGAQGIPALQAAQSWYPARSSLRTEGALTYTVFEAWKKAGGIEGIRTRWLDKADASSMTFDYDAAYDYEGLANAAVPGLEAFYVWRVGSIEGSKKLVSLLHHKNGDSMTPYYAALRDLASGVDSFETLGGPMPAGGKDALDYDPAAAPAGLSKRWSGTGTIEPWKENLPPRSEAESSSAARVMLVPGAGVSREVIAAHWRDNGVTNGDAFTFWAYTEKETSVDLTAAVRDRIARGTVTLKPLGWSVYRVPFELLGIAEADIPAIRSVGFENRGQAAADFLVDEFMIRP